MLATPTLSGDNWASYLNAYMQSIIYGLTQGWEIQTNLMMQNSLIPMARAIIAEDFWESDCDQLFCIDSDICWNPEAFYCLLESRHEFTAGLYPCRQPGLKKYTTRGVFETDEEGWIETNGVGAGFMCLKRSVFKKMRDAYPEMRARDRKRGRWMYMLYDPMIVNFEPLGEDFAFCERWRRIQGKIRCPTKFEFAHKATTIVSGSFEQDYTEEIKGDLNGDGNGSFHAERRQLDDGQVDGRGLLGGDGPRG
jgi:hypothetical protein